MKKINTRVFVSILICVIFIFDLIIPPGVVLSILYIIPLTISSRESKRTILFFTILCCVLTVIDDVLYFDTKIEFSIFIDSILAIIAIALSCIATIRYKMLKAESERRKEENLKAILEMLFITSHKLRSPICSIQGLNILLNEEEQTKEELKKISDYLKDPIEKLDIYSRELTDFLDKIRTQAETGII